MATTPNKGYELMATGTQTDNWGNVLNADVFGIVDNNLGGIVTKSLTNVNVALTADESENAILRLTGVLTGAVQITTHCLGFFFVENATTGAFAVTVRNSSVSGSATIPQSARVTVISDQTNGCRIAGTEDFPSGTRLMFQQSAAPTGWTKITDAAYNDAAIKLTTGSPSTGGTAAFSTAFVSFNLARNQLPNVTITTSTDGTHTHNYIVQSGTARTGSGAFSAANENTSSTSTTSAGAHNHDVLLNGGVTQQPINLAVKYVEVITAQKN